MNFADLFNYDPGTGLLTWKVSRSNRVAVGPIAGSRQTNHKGKSCQRQYLHVRLAEGTFLVHRIVYEMMVGAPCLPDKQIDHINGDSTDNRWPNLRVASRSQNLGNRSRNKFRKYDLPKGVSWHKRNHLFRARCADGPAKYSKSLDVAKAAYDDAANDYFGEFAKNDSPTVIDRISWESAS